MLYDPKWEVPAEVKEEEWRTILRLAAKLLQERGWTQHALKNERGQMCAAGAIIEAHKIVYPNFKWNTNDPSISALQRVLDARMGGRTSIPLWNDSGMRKKEDVIEALLEAANS